MGQLVELPWSMIDGDGLVAQIVSTLAEGRWFKYPGHSVRFDHSQHMDLLRSFMPDLDPAMAQRVYVLEDQIPWSDLATGRVHGSPIFSNCYLDSDTSQLTIVGRKGWQATPAIPDVLSVDYGMIMMSCIGYDRIMLDSDRMPFTGAAKLQQLIEDMHLADAGREKLAARYWCVVHLLRELQRAETSSARAELLTMIDWGLQ